MASMPVGTSQRPSPLALAEVPVATASRSVRSASPEILELSKPAAAAHGRRHGAFKIADLVAGLATLRKLVDEEVAEVEGPLRGNRPVGGSWDRPPTSPSIDPFGERSGQVAVAAR